MATRRPPHIGHGVGLRMEHYDVALAGGLDVDFVEAISENFFGAGGRPRAVIERVRRDRPVVLHGVSLGIGSVNPTPPSYLERLRELALRVEPAWVSDHLCWGHAAGRYTHDLLPLPYTEEAIALVTEKVLRVQDALGRRILLENVSSYVSYASSALTEWAFLDEIARRADCHILLDVNNVLVSARNFGFDPLAYVRGLDSERVAQLHLARAEDRGTYAFDDHRGSVPDPAWALHREVVRVHGAVSSIVEWDQDVPSWEVLRAEQRKAAALEREVLAEAIEAPTDPALRAEQRVRGAEQRVGGVEQRVRGAEQSAALAETQRLLWDVVAHPKGAAEFLATATPEARALAERTFAETADFPRAARLDVYAQGYFWRLFEVLRDDHEIVAWLLGPKRLRNLVVDYVLACPSGDADVGRYGARLPAFLDGHAEGARGPGLADIAAIERAVRDAVAAQDDAAIDLADLRAVPLDRWPALALEARAGVQILRSSLDHEALAAARAADEEPPATLVSGEHWVLVSRSRHLVTTRPVPAAEARALATMIFGGTFAAACEAATSSGDDVDAATVAGFLLDWVRRGLFRAVC